MNMDLDALKTAVDVGLGAIALVYTHRVGKVLEKHEARIATLEKKVKARRRR